MTGSSLAVWRGSPNHYQGRNGYTVDHITLHIMVGSLPGTDTCFRDPTFGAASHYGVGSDGLIYQWVDELNGSWADANMASDCSGITIEHAGGLASIPVTEQEIEASARLCADIARRHGWKRLWHDGLNGNVYLHREIPGTDHFGCPDNTINGLPVDRVINRANQLLGSNTPLTNTNINQEDDMVTAQDIDAIATAVWARPLNGTRAIDRMQGTDNAANGANNKLADTTDYAGDGRKNPMPVRVAWIDRRVRELVTQTIPAMQATLTAQTEAINALAKAHGANPADIASIVDKAVRDKLATLTITINNKQED